MFGAYFGWWDRGDQDMYVGIKIQHHMTLIIKNLWELPQPSYVTKNSLVR